MLPRISKVELEYFMAVFPAQNAKTCCMLY
jgi:hypothetical protein